MQYRSYHPEVTPSRVKGLVAGGAMVIAVAGGVLGHIEGGTPFLVPEVAVGHISEFFNPPECKIEVPSATRQLIHQALIDYVPKPSSGKNPITHMLGESERLNIAEQAEKRGLTTTNYLPYLEQLTTASTFEQVVATVNDYSHKYGITTKTLVPNTAGTPSWVMPFKSSEVDFGLFKTNALDFMQLLYPIPREFIEASGVHSVVISGLIDEGASVERTIVAEGVIYMSGHTFGQAPALPHAVGHNLDLRECGEDGVLNDSEFSGMNPASTEYSEGYKDQLANKRVPAVRSYARRGLNEDKAVNQEAMLGGIDSVYIRSGNTSIANKYELELARLQTILPNKDVVGYLTNITPQQSIDAIR